MFGKLAIVLYLLLFVQRIGAVGDGQVQNLTVIPYATALSITWSGPNTAGVTSYSYRVSTMFGILNTYNIDTNIGMFPSYIDQAVVVDELTPFTFYTISVLGNVGLSSLTFVNVLVSTLEAAPGAPELTSINVINPSTVRVHWHAPPESEQNGPITSFIFDFNNSIIPTPYNQTVETTLSYPISFIIGFVSNFTVEEGITYSVSVRAVNGAGIGLTSESITITTPVAAPPQEIPFSQSEVTNVNLTPTSISFLVPTLTIPFLNGPLIGYDVKYVGLLYSDDVFQPLQSVILPAGNNITLTGLMPNHNYLLFIKAGNSEGYTLPVELSFTLPPTTSSGPSGVPINVTLLVVSYQQINVSWSIDITTVNGVLSHFNIYYYTAIGDSNVVVYNATGINSIGPYTISVTGLSPNTIYSIDVTIVNEVSEGNRSSSVEAETHPKAPDNNLITTVSPTQISSNTIQIYVPTQQLFTTADIAVIYIIADSNSPPLFSSYTPNQRYTSVVGASSGVINVAATLRIQALLDASYYNQQTDYVQFSVGDGGTFLFNGLAVDNIPLRSDTEYQISYYILFYDVDGLLSPEIAYYSNLDTFTTSHRDICLACFLIPICAFVVILFILLVVFVAFFYYYMWDKQERLALPPPVAVSPHKEPLSAVDSLVIFNKRTQSSGASRPTSIYKH